MHQINDAVVAGGKIVLANLPFADGQHVRVIVSELHATAGKSSIHEVRRALRGAIERFDDPFEPCIPAENWEMLK